MYIQNLWKKLHVCPCTKLKSNLYWLTEEAGGTYWARLCCPLESLNAPSWPTPEYHRDFFANSKTGAQPHCWIFMGPRRSVWKNVDVISSWCLDMLCHLEFTFKSNMIKRKLNDQLYSLLFSLFFSWFLVRSVWLFLTMSSGLPLSPLCCSFYSCLLLLFRRVTLMCQRRWP